ncbi:hypothetical protein [uncultured Comamonas sp.]|uniref:hypothetical protein n=1 Tax=uncultured Comamonas sp. TaxID=114710 RepID=UPI0025D85836|nr:hypothetical protein [uncultured Comamonas sp.]
MFESIIYKNSIGPGPLIDIGALAEGLLFYGRVAIVGNSATVKDVLTRIPPFVLLSLMRDGRLEFYYQTDQTGVSTNQEANGRSLHGLVQFSSPNHTIEKVGPEAFKAAAGGTSQAKVGASQFSRLLRPIDHSKFDQESILEALADHVATEASVQSLIRTVVPSFRQPNELRFRIERQNQSFYVDTNIDFVRLNELYHKTVPASHSSLSEAYFLALLQGAYEASYFAGALNSEIAVHPVERALQATAIEGIVRRHRRSETQLESFVDLTLANGHAIREAVNSGAVPFSAVVKLLDSADKFRHWLRQQPNDAGLVHAYYQETIQNSWAEKLPAKSIRWGVFSGLGLTVDALGAGGLGTAAGLALSAVDSFLADKLVKGWKPHHFVEGDLRSLFDPQKQKSAERKPS